MGPKVDGNSSSSSKSNKHEPEESGPVPVFTLKVVNSVAFETKIVNNDSSIFPKNDLFN